MGIENANAISTTKSESTLPMGKPKSGRTWKVKQNFRSSAQNRKGVLSHMCKTYEQRKEDREKLDNARQLEKSMKEEKQRHKEEEKARREEKLKRRMQNEYKNSVYQVINPEKIKGMSKKQLRQVKKTSVNKLGQVELVNPWSGKA